LTGSTALGKGLKESEGCRKRRKNGWRSYRNRRAKMTMAVIDGHGHDDDDQDD